MIKEFEFSIDIHAPCEEVFNILADPEKAAEVATASTNVEELTQKPATVGARWVKKSGPFHRWKTHYLVTKYDRPCCLATQLTGSISAVVEYTFEPVASGTKVTERLKVESVPWPASNDLFGKAQRDNLEAIKTYLERGTTKGSEDELLRRVKYSFTTAPSTFVKRRKQVTLNLETTIAAQRRDVFDTVVTRVDRFWEWMVDRSDPSGWLDVSPDWPKPGSQYWYRVRSKLPFNTWETGTIRILECTPPEHALMREEQNLRLFKAVMLIDWKCEEVENGTHLTVRHEVVMYNYFVNRSFTGDFETTARWLQKQVANIIRVCEQG